jgi:hypothetical protein
MGSLAARHSNCPLLKTSACSGFGTETVLASFSPSAAAMPRSGRTLSCNALSPVTILPPNQWRRQLAADVAALSPPGKVAWEALLATTPGSAVSVNCLRSELCSNTVDEFRTNFTLTGSCSSTYFRLSERIVVGFAGLVNTKAMASSTSVPPAKDVKNYRGSNSDLCGVWMVQDPKSGPRGRQSVVTIHIPPSDSHHFVNNTQHRSFPA